MGENIFDFQIKNNFNSDFDQQIIESKNHISKSLTFSKDR